MSTTFQKHQFTIIVTVLHVLFLVLFGLFGKFESRALPGSSKDHSLESKYPMFQNTNVMVFIGFGFLMTFLRRYGFSSVSINLLLACFTIEWSMIVRGLLSFQFRETTTFTISIDELLTADFAAVVVLISMGAILGKLSPTQYIIMAFLETPAAAVIEHAAVHKFEINDVGGSMLVHAFGAYFGLACSRAFARPEQRNHEHEGSIYHSDIFAMIGSLFLFVFWPSFNAAVAAPADAQHRAVVNTFLSLAACTITTFVISQATHPKKRFHMMHIANATLAGGVAIGTSANVILDPVDSLLIGTVAGIVSVIGYKYITPFLSNKLGIHDTCGVHNLHGMPGVIAGLSSALIAYFYKKERYGDSVSIIYHGMSVEKGKGHDESWQAVLQLSGLGVIMAGSIITGAITGLILRLPAWNQVRDKENFSDKEYYETPSDFDFTSNIISCIDHVEVNEKSALNSQKTEINVED